MSKQNNLWILVNIPRPPQKEGLFFDFFAFAYPFQNFASYAQWNDLQTYDKIH